MKIGSQAHALRAYTPGVNGRIIQESGNTIDRRAIDSIALSIAPVLGRVARHNYGLPGRGRSLASGQSWNKEANMPAVPAAADAIETS